MNTRSGLFTFLLFLLLLAMILLQVLSMVQSDRLYERLNFLLDTISGRQIVTSRTDSDSTAESSEKYPGDQGDWLITSLYGETRTLNPISVDADIKTNEITVQNIFERLFEYDLDANGVKLIPWLAESYEISDDGLEITVKLKKGIRFSDGVPLTADDVMFTYETIMNPGIDVPDLRNYYKNVKEVVKLNERTVKFVFNEIYWKTLESVGIFEVLPKHIYKFDDPKEFNKHISNPVGSGPYVFEKWDVGNQIVLSRNENYWGKKPKIKKRVYRFITNTTAALQALRSHEIDILEPTSEQFDDMSKDEEFKKEFNLLAFWRPSEGFSFIGWNQKRPFFADRRVRLAMTHIIDRDSILKHILKGRGTIVTGPFYIHGKQNDPDIQPWPYDPQKAAQLLDEAGWIDTDGDGIRDKNGVSFRFKYMYVPGGPSSETIAKLLKDEASKVGIEVLPDPVEWSIFVERMNNRNFDSLVLMWCGTIESDPYQIFHSSQIEGRGNNFISFSNAEADKIIEQARVELDENKRYALYHQFHKILHEEQPYTFLYTRRSFIFLDKRFENVRIHKLGIDLLEWYVPKEKQRYK